MKVPIWPAIFESWKIVESAILSAIKAYPKQITARNIEAGYYTTLSR
jgi:hypothetical protein